MQNIVLAGARSVFGLSEIKKAFPKEYSVSFADAPFMSELDLHGFPETEKIIFTTELPPESLVIPLSEYWISWCVKNGQCLISERALKSSRSKSYFYNLMEEKGFDSPRIYSGLSESMAVLEEGKRIVVKPDGLHSGYGVEILDKAGKERLSKYLEEAPTLHNRTLRIMEIENHGAILTEAVEGTEYSADCFICNGRVSVVRICRKKTVILNEKPCSAVYILLNGEDPLYGRFSEILEGWMKALFDETDISFGQFDFIVTEKGRTVPVDFASRVGGGISELLIESGRNLYAGSIASAFGTKEISMDFRKNLVQFMYLPVVSGYVHNDEYPLKEGRKHVFKKKGDYVISNPSSVGSRIALVVREQEGEISDEEVSALLLGSPWISAEKPSK